MGQVSIGEDQAKRRDDSEHARGAHGLTSLFPKSPRAKSEMAPAEMRKLVVRQGRRIDALERELKLALAKVAKLSQQLGYASYQARSLKRRGRVTDGSRMKRVGRIVTVNPGDLK